LSRAFVKESDRDEALALPEPTLPVGVQNAITPAGARRFADEHAALEAERRGLRGAEGPEARARIAAIDARLAWIGRRTLTFVVVETPQAPERVVFGATVDCDVEGQPRTWRIVGVDEVDPARGDVSWQSPIGKALIGARVGDVVTVKTPRADDELEIVRIRGG
jgi:transcription elongation factor GreB